MKRSTYISPNTLTIARILLTPLGVYALFYQGGENNAYRILAWTIYFVLGMTDILDGKWARRTNQITPLGQFLDPVADKVLIGSAMISLSILHLFPWWITVLILVREIGITIFRLLVIRDGVIPASKSGKAKTLVQNFGVSFFVLPLPEWLHWFRNGFIGVAIILTITSAISYIRGWYLLRSVNS